MLKNLAQKKFKSTTVESKSKQFYKHEYIPGEPLIKSPFWEKMTSQSFYISTSYLSFWCLQLWPYIALKKYGYVLICSPKSQASVLNRQKICFLRKTCNQIPKNYEGWTFKGSPTVSPEVANSHHKKIWHMKAPLF